MRFYLDEVQFINFFSWLVLLVMFKKSCRPQQCEDFSPVFSSRSLIILAFMFLVHGKNQGLGGGFPI